MQALRAGMRLALWIGYPLAIYAALVWFEPRVVAAGLACVLLLRRWGGIGMAVDLLGGVSGAAFVGLLILCVGASVANDETVLRLYPAAVSAAFLAVFGLSLVFPPTAVERIARLRNSALPNKAVRYTRQVTSVWCGFFAVNGAIAAWTALAASRELWALYNGFIAYVAMGCLFAGEWFLRRKLFPEAR